MQRQPKPPRSVITTVVSIAALVALLPAHAALAQGDISTSGYIILAEQANVPVRDAGVLRTINVRAGDAVSVGQMLAELDDDEARIHYDRAGLDLAIAQLNVTKATAINSARSKLTEGKLARDQAKIAEQIAGQLAKNRISIRVAKASRDTAQANLDRAKRSRQAVKTSVSQAEIDRLSLVVRQHALEMEAAEFELALNGLRLKLAGRGTEEASQALERMELDVQQAETDLETLKLNEKRFATARQLAAVALEKRHVKAPLSGVVAEITPRRGQWVEKGETLLRIIRLDRLQAEGYVPAESSRGLLKRDAIIEFHPQKGPTQTAKGKVIFVSKEISRTDGKVQIRVEFENSDLTFQPGMTVRILASGQ